MVYDLRQAGAEIKVTDAMIEAGAYVLCDFDPLSDAVSDVALQVLKAMMSKADGYGLSISNADRASKRFFAT